MKVKAVIMVLGALGAGAWAVQAQQRGGNGQGDQDFFVTNGYNIGPDNSTYNYQIGPYGTTAVLYCGLGNGGSSTFASHAGAMYNGTNCTGTASPTAKVITGSGWDCSHFSGSNTCAAGTNVNASDDYQIYDEGNNQVADISPSWWPSGNVPDKANCVNHASWGCAVNPNSTSAQVCALTKADCKTVCAWGLFGSDPTTLCGSYSGDPGYSE